MTHAVHLKHTSQLILVIIISFALQTPGYAQTYEATLVNKGALFASGALLQDYDNDGDLDIVIIRKRDSGFPGGIEWLENDEEGGFPRHELVNDLLEPGHIESGDMDEDGDIDYVVADKGTDGTNGELALYEMLDDGTLAKMTLLANEPFDELDLADFDDDGDLDIVAVAFGLDVLYVWFNDGGLSFNQTPINESVNQLRVVETVDIDSDGDIDILVNDLLLRNNGSGVFDDVQELFTDTGFPSAGRDFAVEDLDNNGSLDIITFRTSGLGGLYFLDGSNNFAYSQIERDGIDLGGSIIVADLDGNGLKDIIRQNFGDEYVAVLYQESQMSFRKEFIEQNWDSEVRGSQMALGDLDNDGDEDLIFAEDGNVDGDISWFENIDGTLHRHYLYNEIKAPRRTRLGDLDGDGDLDIVVAAGNSQGSTSFSEREIVWYENRGTQGYFEARIEDNIYYPYDIELADLDGDAMPDIVASGEQDSVLYWYKKNGPAWDRTVISDDINLPQGIEIADVDSDGIMDIILAASGDDHVFWFRNDGAANFTRNVVDDDLPFAMEMEAADFDEDGDTDIVAITSDSSNAVILYTNDGQETFEKQMLFSGHFAVDLEVGDWTGDGAVDIIAGFNTRSVDPTRNVVLFTNDGSGGFTDAPLFVENQELTFALKLVDTDLDNDLDLVIATENVRPALAILPNEAGVAGEIIVIENDNPHDFTSIDAGDIDQDGDFDLVATGIDSESLYLFTNSTFEPVAVADEEIPSRFLLYQNYPNPFNPSTTISFDIAEASIVRLQIYDILGREVQILLNKHFAPGEHKVTFQAENLPSGVYLYRLSTNGQVQTNRMTLLR